MHLNFKTLLTSFSLFIAWSMSLSPAMAGGLVGNGGSGVVCRNPDETIASIEILDFYEARVLRNLTISLGAADLPVKEKIATAIGRWQRLDSGRAALYSDWIAKFENEARKFDGVILADIPDTSHLILPVKCKVEQIIIQREPQFPEDARYTINKTLWDHLSPDNQAGLILHEIVYRQAIEQGAINSLGVRYLVGLFASTRSNDLTIPVYEDYLRRSGFKDMWIDTLHVTIGDRSPVFQKNGRLSSAILLNGSKYQTPWGVQPLRCEATFDTNGDIVAGLVADDHTILVKAFGQEFAVHGRLSNSPCDMPEGDNPVIGSWSKYTFVLDENRQPLFLTLLSTRPIEYVGAGYHLFLYDGILFDQDGSGGIATSVTTRDDPGSLNIADSVCYPDGEISFYRSGLIESVRNLSRCRVTVGSNTLLIHRSVRFYDTKPGHLWFGELPEDAILAVGVKWKIKFKGGANIIFYRSGAIESGTLAEDFEQINRQGQAKFFGRGMYVHFDEEGYITGGRP